MQLANERAYCLHELRIELGNEPHGVVYLVDDTGGQVLVLRGELGRFVLRSRGLLDGAPVVLDELSLRPGARDVVVEAALRDHVLSLEVIELHSHYRRLAVYEQWMVPVAAQDADALSALPGHLHLRRVWANVVQRQLELELVAGDARQLVVLRGLVGLEVRVDASNRDAFAHEVRHGRLDDATRAALLEGSSVRGPAWRALEARLRGVRELRMHGKDLELVALFEA